MSIYTEKAVALFREGYNCAQAVTGAFAEQFGMSQEDALRFSEGMGAGMGRLRLTCGAVSAMALLAGLKLSNGKPNDLATRKEVYAVVQEMTKAFQEKNSRDMDLLIQERCSAYISEQAQTFGLVCSPRVETEQTEENVFVPVSVTMDIPYHAGLSQIVAEDMGIDAQHQKWLTSEG